MIPLVLFQEKVIPGFIGVGGGDGGVRGGVVGGIGEVGLSSQPLQQIILRSINPMYLRKGIGYILWGSIEPPNAEPI